MADVNVPNDICLSVVVPVYNVAGFLNKCLDSLLKTEGISSTEIILVDDGSTDESGSIADSYSEKYGFITCYHKENGGLSDARNHGLRHAKGKYVFFCDSDDMIIPGSFGHVIRTAAETDADILQWNGMCIDADDKEKVTDYSRRLRHEGLPEDGVPMTGLEMLYKQINHSKDCPFVVWLRAYRRDFLNGNKLFFEKGLVHEDEMWSPVVLTKAKSVLYIPEVVYQYRLRDDSIMSRIGSDPGMHAGVIAGIMNRQYEYYSSNITDVKYGRVLLAHWARKYMGEISQFGLYRYECCDDIPRYNILRSSRGFKDKFRGLILFVFGSRIYGRLASLNDKSKVR